MFKIKNPCTCKKYMGRFARTAVPPIFHEHARSWRFIRPIRAASPLLGKRRYRLPRPARSQPKRRAVSVGASGKKRLVLFHPCPQGGIVPGGQFNYMPKDTPLSIFLQQVGAPARDPRVLPDLGDDALRRAHHADDDGNDTEEDHMVHTEQERQYDQHDADQYQQRADP